MPEKLALTDLSIKRFPLPESGTATYWDTTTRGLGVRVSPKGARTFIVLMGSGSRHKLGRYPHLSLKTARDEAGKLLAKKTLGTGARQRAGARQAVAVRLPGDSGARTREAHDRLQRLGQG